DLDAVGHRDEVVAGWPFCSRAEGAEKRRCEREGEPEGGSLAHVESPRERGRRPEAGLNEGFPVSAGTPAMPPRRRGQGIGGARRPRRRPNTIGFSGSLGRVASQLPKLRAQPCWRSHRG